MNIASLRVKGTDKALKEISDSLSVSIGASWKKGDTKRRGGKYHVSGFNATVADTETPKQLINEITKFLLSSKNNNVTFTSGEIDAQLDIGIGVGSEDQFTASVTFTPENLKKITDIGLELTISAYPIADDE